MERIVEDIKNGMVEELERIIANITLTNIWR